MTLAVERRLEITTSKGSLRGDLAVPRVHAPLVLFANGGGRCRMSGRSRRVAEGLQRAGLATLLFDLLTPAEDEYSHNRVDVLLLGDRVLLAYQTARRLPELARSPVGLFGASTGAAAALVAASELGDEVGAVVSRGGRPEIVGEALARVTAPSLLLVGEHDTPILEGNRRAREVVRGPSELVIVPGATRLFREPGALEAVTAHATRWFSEHLGVPLTSERTERRQGERGERP